MEFSYFILRELLMLPILLCDFILYIVVNFRATHNGQKSRSELRLALIAFHGISGALSALFWPMHIQLVERRAAFLS